MVDCGGVKGTTPTMKRILLSAALSAGLAKSATWIAAGYAAMESGSFLSAGAVENVVKPMIIFVQ